jgi:hypothetical protein
LRDPNAQTPRRHPKEFVGAIIARQLEADRATIGKIVPAAIAMSWSRICG